MTKLKDIFGKITSIENMLQAHKNALKGKRNNDSATRFNYNLISHLTKLQTELKNDRYKPSAYRNKTICEPKLRLIEAPAYRDRIVHHSIHQLLCPFYEKIFINDSFACRPNRGTHSATKRVQYFLRYAQPELYVCQIDISKYYASINHNKLIEILSDRIDDKRLINLLTIIINSTDSGTEHDHLFDPDSYFFTKGRRGIPIGNLTSQLFANVYLHQADNYAKQHFKIRNYVRYMDDILFFHHDKAQLHKWKKAMTKFLYEELYLTINPRKVRIYPARQGVSFVGFIINPSYKLIRSSSVKRFKKRFKKQLVGMFLNEINAEIVEKSFEAWRAHAAHASSDRLITKMQNLQDGYIFAHKISQLHHQRIALSEPPIQLSLFNDL